MNEITIVRNNTNLFFSIMNSYYITFYKIAIFFLTRINNIMKIQKINNSPTFKAIELSTKEGRKVAGIIREYRKQANPTLKEQLVDIFAPHIEKEAQRHEGILKEDFKQDMYLCLFDNIDKVDLTYHPSANLVRRINEVTTQDCYATMGYKSIEELSEIELENLGRSEDRFLQDFDVKNIAQNAFGIITKSKTISPRVQNMLLMLLKGKTISNIGDMHNLDGEYTIDLIGKNIKKLRREILNERDIKCFDTLKWKSEFSEEKLYEIAEHFNRVAPEPNSKQIQKLAPVSRFGYDECTRELIRNMNTD